MAIPTPPPDNSGGWFVIKYTNGVQTHRMRFHVLPFNADAVGSYVSPPAGGEANVAATFTALANNLKSGMSTAFTMTLDAVYQQAGGVAAQIFTVTPPAAVSGTIASAASAFELFQSFNFRTLGGHRFRFFMYQLPGLVAPGAGILTAGGNSTIAYLTGATTAVRGHDGTALVAPAHFTIGLNKRLRRRSGDA